MQNRHRPDPSAYGATLAPAVRRLGLDDMAATLTDTIAFVRHLPHELVDAAAPDALITLATVHTVLSEIRARDVPELLLMNNTDITSRPIDCIATCLSTRSTSLAANRRRL